MASATLSNHDVLLSSLTNTPHDFLQPPTALHASTLSLLKDTLDPLASNISQTQHQRLQVSRASKKRGDRQDEENVLRLQKVHVDGFAIEQVWEQARRVIDAARKEAERGLELLKEKHEAQGAFSDEEDDDDETSLLGEEGVDYEVEGVDDGEEEYHTSDDEDEDMEGLEEEVEEDDDDDDDDDEDIEMGSDEEDENDQEQDEEEAEEYVLDPHGLNDGFFSIDDFNRQSELLEQADVRGDQTEIDDDEEVDWGSNPLGPDGRAAAGEEDEDMDDAEEDDGPTFGNADLNAPFSDDDADDAAEIEQGEMDDMAGLSNTNSIKYAEFFAPPAKKATRKNKKGRPNPHNFPAAEPTKADDNDQDVEADMQRTMEAVHRDLFDESDNDEGNASDDDLETLDPADPRSRRSTHERRRAEIEKEIRRLEAANVARRDWTLSGEARAADRPLNSLLEEDLDFERAGKPVPVITAEISESIEELIRRRILARDFNDIPRRRPDDLATGSSGQQQRRGRFELDDTKSKKSLAEMYEEDHLKATSTDYVSAADEATAKQQAEIEGLWKSIAHSLDSLSSFHFKPGPKAAQLDIRVDAPVVRLEDARPSAGVDAAGASQLAPQEVYRAGEAIDRRSELVATSKGMPVAREEMSREERKRRRRRDKERERKKNGSEAPKIVAVEKEGARKRAKKDVVSDLKRGGVKVIGRKGEITDVDGQAVRSGNGAASAGNYKL